LVSFTQSETGAAGTDASRVSSLSLRQIAGELAKQGMSTSSGRPYAAAAVMRMLERPRLNP